MLFAVSRYAAIGAIVLGGLLANGAAAQNDKPKPPAPPPDKSAEASSGKTSELTRYCANVAPVAAEARIAWETRRLNELNAEIKQRIADLEKTEAETRDWVSKREALMNTASDDVVAIYSKMDPEAAAAQLAIGDESVAVSVLHKLKAAAASAILDQMDAARAARLTGLILAVSPPDKKS